MVLQHFSAQLFLPSPATVGRPATTEISDLARRGEFRQFRQCFGKNGLVARPVVGRSESAAYGMIDERGARRQNSTHNVVGSADHQGGDTLAFNDMSNETDGLMAEWSIGN